MRKESKGFAKKNKIFASPWPLFDSAVDSTVDFATLTGEF